MALKFRIEDLGIEPNEGYPTSFEFDLNIGDWLFIGSKKGMGYRELKRAGSIGDVTYIVDKHSAKRLVHPKLEEEAAQFRVYPQNLQYVNMQSEMVGESLQPTWNNYRGVPNLRDVQDVKNLSLKRRMADFNAQAPIVFLEGESVLYGVDRQLMKVTYVSKD